MRDELVLVTVGSGFIGAHCIAELLNAGYIVRTTVRFLGREEDVLSMLAEAGATPGNRLSFVAADLEKDAGWSDAVAGCAYVLHVASPFPRSLPKHEDELIVPAREGALRVLRSSRDAGVRRVVLTSSFAAIGYGHKPQEMPFDETNWTNLDGDGLTPYVKSKTWLSEPLGTSTEKAARSSFPWSIRWESSARCWRAIMRLRSYCSATHGRSHARLSKDLFRRRRCARCR